MDALTDNQDEATPSRKRGGRWIKFGIALLAVLLLAVLNAYVDVQGTLRALLVWIDGLGAWGPALFVLIYILSCVVLVPASLLTLGAGAVFGVMYGSIYVSIASTIGAAAAFLVGRYLARGWVARSVADRPRFRAIDEAVANEGWKIVGLTRLSPIFPFNVLNYAFGLTRVRFTEYVVASWIGMLPGTILYVYIGSLAGDLATLGASPQERSPAQWGLYVFGLAATILVTVIVTRMARRALTERID